MTTQDYAEASIWWYIWRTAKLWIGEEVPRIGWDFLRSTAAMLLLTLLIVTAPVSLPIAAFISRRYWVNQLRKHRR